MSRRFDLNARNDNGLGTFNKHNNKTAAQNQENDAEKKDEANSQDDNKASETEEKDSSITPKVKTPLKVDKLKDVKIKIPIVLKVQLILIASAALFFIFLIFFITLLFGGDTGMIGSGIGGLATGGYYKVNCQEMTVTDGDGNIIGTYDNTDYVAGVVAAEVGGFNNLEVYKAFAVGARTYGETHSGSNCTIAGNATRQAFRDITNETADYAKLIYQAVEETEGIVMLKNGSISGESEYDAFCYIEKNNTYYTLSQKNQKISTDWVESHISNFGYKNCPCELKDESMTECWSDKHTWTDGGHGRGMSQYGALYLATEEDYTYAQILNFYYDDIALSTNSFASSIAGLEIKDTTSAQVLHTNLSAYLSEHGASIDDLNNFISTSVNENGYGTRAGAVTAAVSLINYLYDNGKVRIPYYWGGDYQHNGVMPSFGEETHCSISPGGDSYCYTGLDCSGFVSWAIKNGGYSISRHTTAGFHNDYSGDSCNITSSSCTGQPGDLINSNGCHVQMIVSVDEDKGIYYVAESTGSHGVIMRAWNMHAGNCGSKETRILHMNSLYGD